MRVQIRPRVNFKLPLRRRIENRDGKTQYIGINDLLDNIVTTNVDKLNSLVLQEVQSNVDVLGLLKWNTRVLVVSLDLFRVRDDLNQIDEQQAVGPVSLEVIDTKTSFLQVVVTPTGESFLLDISPVGRLSGGHVNNGWVTKRQ